MGGVSVLGVDTDDFLGTCGKGSYPLLKGINKQMRQITEIKRSVMVDTGSLFRCEQNNV